MINRNPCIANLEAGYLFPEIAKRKKAYLQAHPDAKIISLGIGNTTEPIPPHINEGLINGAKALGDEKTYSGYGEDLGNPALREKIARVFYRGLVSSDEVFISDGAKCDIGRLQTLFGSSASIAVQDPSYPVYVDGSVLAGAGGRALGGGAGYQGITYLPCTVENGYFPDLAQIPPNSLVYFCSPNNPTGAVADRSQLKALVDAAAGKSCLIIFDAAYSEYVRDSALPKSIYEIEGAKLCAIEVNSFSKSAGFTGVRLGWSVVPRELKYASGENVHADWSRICATIFNGASNIAQAGGLAALDEQGLKEMHGLTDYYLRNARLIRDTLQKLGISCTGGENSPYIWARFPGRDSWEVFSALLEKCQIVSTPGSGFGPAGQGFVRFSAFGRYADIEEACRRLERF
jgi:LL-diaminopimelate aminotransferase